MRHPSIRGIGIRYVLALTLPVTGLTLVLYTLVQLIGFSFAERGTVNATSASPAGARMTAISGSTTAVPRAIPQQSYPPAAPKK
ncbi:MAG: hypothetical protein HY568_03260 [Candidatus Latescibacteria bacterium]|nr:hypothetical protein [Candidatus Latescibacterota bacterium]